MVSGLRHERRRDAPRRHALWQQRPSYCRILLQGSGAGIAGGGGHRCARRERSALDQRHARQLIVASLALPEGRGCKKREPVMSVYTVHEPPLPAGAAASDVERFAFVRDGFSWWAFLLAPLWMLRHRMWLVLIGPVWVAGAI